MPSELSKSEFIALNGHREEWYAERELDSPVDCGHNPPRGAIGDSMTSPASWLRCYRCWSQNLEVQVHYEGIIKVDPHGSRCPSACDDRAPPCLASREQFGRRELTYRDSVPASECGYTLGWKAGCPASESARRRPICGAYGDGERIEPLAVSQSSQFEGKDKSSVIMA